MPANSGHTIVDRGDPDDWDFDKNDFTKDGTWRKLDLSSILPAGDIFVRLLLFSNEGIGNKRVLFRDPAKTNEINCMNALTYAFYKPRTLEGVVKCNADSKIDYLIEAGNWQDLDLLVRGWFI